METLASMINTLHQVHLDNSRQYYFARQWSRNGLERSRPIMPATPFVFEYFIYNSIYQIDWAESEKSGNRVEHPVSQDEEGNTSRLTEGKQQSLLEKFLKERCSKELLVRAFEPLAHLRDLKGSWTRIRTESPDKLKQGNDFFRRIWELGEMQRQGTLEPTGKVFRKIGNCRRFVYGVRCNIFHGSKSMAAFEDAAQCRRIEVYELFLQCLVSLFFLAWKRSPVGADDVQVPVEIPMTTEPPTLIASSEILRHVAEGLMKPEDSRLIQRVRRKLDEWEEACTPDGALFYPSSGKDIVTPVLMGLPHCTDFHFYDESGSQIPRARTDTTGRRPELDPDFIRALRRILGVRMTRFDTTWSFEFDGVERRIHLVHADNKAFLGKERALVLLFRRGDSEGEGGSDQSWDKELFPMWSQMIPPNRHCIVLTDGEPGGISPDLLRYLERIEFSNSERNRPYYIGRIQPS
jgi:hypothetical protein